jgi:L-aspartate oxidase
MTFPQRYLVRFGPKHTRHLFTDVLVIGGGIAGLRAALAVPEPLQVLAVTKDKIQQSNSAYAQGGIAAVRDPEDRFEDHIEDTLRAGAGLCDPGVVDLVVREAPKQIDDLIHYGSKFDETPGMEGGHSYRRIIHALGDATGFEVMRAIIETVGQKRNVTVWDRTFTIDLLTHDGACVGAHVQVPQQGPLLIWAKQVILASGGAGMIYRETTNPPVATGDGMAAAYRAGAVLRDMEFMQFHPTVLYVAGSSRYLISEAVRGFGAYLRDKDGIRFMPEVDERAELATRDVVAQAIVRRMEQTQHPNVYLDLSHKDPKEVLEHFPGIARVCREFGLDITRDLIPVRPGAHYMIGGVQVDAEGRTSLANLWAAGRTGIRCPVWPTGGRGGGADARHLCRSPGGGTIRAGSPDAGPGHRRPDQFVTEPDGPLDGDHPPSLSLTRSGAAGGLLVPLRAPPRIPQPGGVGAAEPVDRRSPDDLGGAGANGIAGSPLPLGSPPPRRREVESASCLPVPTSRLSGWAGVNFSS